MSLLTFNEDGARPPEGEDLRGQTLDGRYRIESRLDAIADRSLWHASDLQRERPVTLLVWAREASPPERVLMAALLRQPEGVHCAFVASEACGRTPEGASYTVHAPAKGLFFDTWLERYSLPAHDMVELAVDLVSALGALHRSGQIHGRLGTRMLFLEAHAQGSSLRLFDAGIEAIPAVPRGSAVRGEMVHVGALLERFCAATDTFDPAPRTPEILAAVGALIERTREIATEPLPDLETLASKLRAIVGADAKARAPTELHRIPWVGADAPPPAPEPAADEPPAPVELPPPPSTDFSGLIALPGPRPAPVVPAEDLLPELAFPLPPPPAAAEPPPLARPPSPPMPTRAGAPRVRKGPAMVPLLVIGGLVVVIVVFAVVLLREPKQPPTRMDDLLGDGLIALSSDAQVPAEPQTAETPVVPTVPDALDATAPSTDEVVLAAPPEDAAPAEDSAPIPAVEVTPDSASVEVTPDSVSAEVSPQAGPDAAVSGDAATAAPPVVDWSNVPRTDLPFEQVVKTRAEIDQALLAIERAVTSARADRKGSAFLGPLRRKLHESAGAPIKLAPKAIYFLAMSQLDGGQSESDLGEMLLRAYLRGNL
jgi:hypothetical protein